MRFSIITVVRNNIAIEHCIKSLIEQSYKNLQYIIIDGASSDGTSELIAKLCPMIEANTKDFIYLRESDSGIYNAMNKGLSLATGDIIGFLNADDSFASKDVLSKLAEAISCIDGKYFALTSNVNLCRYGRVLRSFNREIYRGHLLDLSGLYEVINLRALIKSGKHPAHPSFYATRASFEDFLGFDESFKIAGDYDLMSRFCLRDDFRLYYLDLLSVEMSAGGASNGSIRQILNANYECIKSLEKNGVKNPILVVLKKLISKIRSKIAHL